MKDYFTSDQIQWHYIGIDDDPPSGKIHVLTSGGISIIGNKHTPEIIAWHPLMKRDKLKERCQSILRGLPELKMIGCICKHPQLVTELANSLEHYTETRLAEFTDLVRSLDRKAHSDGQVCIPNFHR